jgi:hypothetical protein
MAQGTWVRLALPSTVPRGDTMEKLIDLFCHAIRIYDPLSIKIAVGVIGGGLPMIFLFGLFIWLGELVAGQRESTMAASHRPIRKRRAGRRSPAARG